MSPSTTPDETREYTVEGMSCAHCAASVREEVSALEAVSTVDVDVASGRVAVTGTALDDHAVWGAVAEAGYKVV
jgi:copper chaperone CopZ